jgi:hypothetical protein
MLLALDYEVPSATMGMYITIWQLKPMIDEARLAQIEQRLQVDAAAS